MFQKLYTVTLSNGEKEFDCAFNDSILTAGLRHGLSMHHECNNGSCGVCKAKIIQGEVYKNDHHDFHLTPEEIDNGEFLMCCNSPRTDVVLEADLIGDVKTISLQYIETKVKKVEFVSDELCILTLRPPRSKTLQFIAGQEVLLSYNNEYASRYPLASCPCNDMELEFHIRNIESDLFASAIFSQTIKLKSMVSLEGPKGIFVLNESSVKPMLFIAWDNGFAAIRSLIEQALALDLTNPISFYWAFPESEIEPYLDNQARSWDCVADKYHYENIPCKFDRSAKNDCKYIATKIYDSLDKDTLNLSDIYISAPAILLIELGEMLFDNGLPEDQLKASPIINPLSYDETSFEI